MVDAMGQLGDTAFPIERSNLYTLWLCERSAINEHKWHMSEKAGYDVGWDAARWDWDMRFRAGWLADQKARGVYPK